MKKETSFVIITLLLVIDILFSIYYRPYIYSHKINDFHIADSFRNFNASFCLLCAYYLLHKKTNQMRPSYTTKLMIKYGQVYIYSIGSFTTILGYEIFQAYMDTKWFDIYDIIYTIIATIFIILMYKIKLLKEI